MKTILHNELLAAGAFTGKLPPLINKVVEANSFNIPYRMKALIAMSEIMAFSSQFKRNIILPDTTHVPINSISFCIAASGGHKDSSLRMTRKIFTPAYELLESKREQFATTTAIKKAQDAGESLATAEDIYKSYYEPPAAIFLKDVTPQGLIQYFNDISTNPIGAGLMVNSEISDEFNTNPNFPDIIKILSEAYDLGIVEASYTKGKEFRNNGVSGVPFSALFIGSYYMLMYNPQLRAKFISSFMSKLSRRCSFTYVPEKIEDPIYTSGLELIQAEQKIRNQATASIAALVPTMLSIAEHNSNYAGTPITLSADADMLSLILKRYDSEVAASDCGQESADALYRKNRYWRALKLAGSLALMDCSNVIEASHMIEAINLTELFSLDMHLFESALNKADHERMADYIKSLVQLDGKAFISIHDLKKRGFTIATTANKLKELCTLANAYDPSGIYSTPHDSSGIHYEAIIKSDVVGISFKPINLTKLNAATTPDQVRQAKADIAATTAYGYECAETTFADLANLLQGAYAYSPFKFTNGIRGKDHISGGCKFLVYDIDSSNITAEEAHFMLSDLNHHIALGSDPNNHFKFRVLIELDSVVDISSLQWKHFYSSVASDLALTIDQLPQSQIFFSYPDRPIYSNLDASPLFIKPYLVTSADHVANKPLPTHLTPAQRKALLADPVESFSYAYNAPMGAGSRSLIRLAYHLRDLAVPADEALAIISEAHDFWDHQMPSDRFEAILTQATRILS